MAKKRKKHEISLLMRRWAFDVANHLCWDLEEDGFRSFKASRFINFEVLENYEKYGQLPSGSGE